VVLDDAPAECSIASTSSKTSSSAELLSVSHCSSSVSRMNSQARDMTWAGLRTCGVFNVVKVFKGLKVRLQPKQRRGG